MTVPINTILHPHPPRATLLGGVSVGVNWPCLCVGAVERGLSRCLCAASSLAFLCLRTSPWACLRRWELAVLHQACVSVIHLSKSCLFCLAPCYLGRSGRVSPIQHIAKHRAVVFQQNIIFMSAQNTNNFKLYRCFGRLFFDTSLTAL